YPMPAAFRPKRLAAWTNAVTVMNCVLERRPRAVPLFDDALFIRRLDRLLDALIRRRVALRQQDRHAVLRFSALLRCSRLEQIDVAQTHFTRYDTRLTH